CAVLVASSFTFHSSCAALRTLHSFPTRRSSDLLGVFAQTAVPLAALAVQRHPVAVVDKVLVEGAAPGGHHLGDIGRTALASLDRSEEHTSELQSRENLVCRLLLEKKKPLHMSGS